jgi:predicted transcriptional regulator
MKRTTVKLPDDLDARLRQLAERRGINVSSVVREAIAEYVGRRRPRSFASGASGCSDLSERIEEILAAGAREP